jgi:putative MATE family efflux protein
MKNRSISKLNDRFTDQSFFRALPFEWMAAFSLALGDMADALVMGQSMGATGLAAVSLALPVFMVINLIMHGMGAGGSVHFSKLLGNGNCDNAKRSFSQVLQGALVLGVFLALMGNLFLTPLMAVLGTTAADGSIYEASSTYVRMILTAMPLFFASYILNYYLRNDDNQKLASVGFAAGNVCDLVLNMVLVLGLKMGVEGAAWSTIIGQIVALCVYLLGLFGKRANNLSYKFVLPDIKEIFRCFKIGVSTSVQYLYQMVFFLLVNNILMRGIGEEGVAVFDVLLNISFLVTYLYDGAAKASQPLISTFCGERNQSGIRRAGGLALIFGNAAGILLSLLFCAFPSAVCTVFGLEGEFLIALGSRALRIYCIGMVFAGTIVVRESFYQAQEDEKSALLLATLRGLIVLIPWTLLFSILDIGLFWWLFPVVEILSLCIFAGLKIFSHGKKREQNEPVLTRMISGRSEEISALTEELEAFCEAHDANPKQNYYVMMTVEEVCIALNEKAFTKPENGLIQVTAVATQDGSFELFIRDNAVKFNAFSLATTDGKIANTALDALGMSIIKNKVSEFFYRHYKGFNILYIKV